MVKYVAYILTNVCIYLVYFLFLHSTVLAYYTIELPTDYFFIIGFLYFYIESYNKFVYFKCMYVFIT